MIYIVFNIEPVPRKETESNGRRRFKAAGQQEYQDTIRMVAHLKTKGKPMMLGPVSVDLTFHMKIPASYSEKKKTELVGKYHIKRPDSDNLQKLFLDSLTGIVYKDDSQIADTKCRKIYAREPYIEFTAKEL